MKLIWISNTYNPADTASEYYIRRLTYESHQEAVDRWRRWLDGKVIGQPKASEKYTSEELKELGMVGVYRLAEP